MASTQVATIEVDGVKVFYRAAGPVDAPVILLLHGFPASSFMFRNLIPLLAKQYRVYAPDLPGFGFTEVPESRKYIYNFANISTTISAFVDALEIQKFAVYIFDYGAPTAIRYTLQHPDRISAIIAQNGNAYVEGFGAEFWAPLRQLWANDTAEQREVIRNAVLNFDATKWQYTFKNPKADQVPPEAYTLDQALMDRPGNKDIQMDLFYDYRTNIDFYPAFQEWLRKSEVPVITIWGKHDPIFIAPGAEAWKKDAKNPEINYIDSTHFALETNEEHFAELILDFLNRRAKY
jgi:pimeloyl-ACP methyl ester carboxylesterase